MPIRGFFADFAEHNAKLVVELDGSQHGADEHHERDLVRDRVLAGEGYLVIRFANEEVITDLQRVVDVILREAQRRRPTAV